jgi:hypothetical protein
MTARMRTKLANILLRRIAGELYRFHRRKLTPPEAYRRTMATMTASPAARFLFARIRKNKYRVGMANYLAMCLADPMQPDGLSIAEFLRHDPGSLAPVLTAEGKVIILGLHNHFSLSATLLGPHAPMMLVTANIAYASNVLRISGCMNMPGVSLHQRENRPLAIFLKSKTVDIYSVLIDIPGKDRQTQDRIDREMLSTLVRAKARFFLVRFDFRDDGSITYRLDGPHFEPTVETILARVAAVYDLGFD